MGMQEFYNETMGQPTKDIEMLRKSFNQSNIKATYFGEMAKLQELKEKVESKEISIEELKSKQLDRIEAMLSSLILHLNIPHQGIITMPNTERKFNP